MRSIALLASLAVVAVVLAAPVASAGQTPPTCNGLAATIVGTDGPDFIEGTPGPDVIHAGAGKDFIFAGAGDDVICGAGGHDRIYGQEGHDIIRGDGGNDRLRGGPGRDLLLGGKGDDLLFGNRQQDRLLGGDGRDEGRGGPAIDVCAPDIEVRICDAPVTAADDATPPATRTVERVIHLSIDGLRADHVRADTMSRLHALFAASASTRNARTDADLTKTLPNHTSQFTGRPVWGPDGHRVDINQDPFIEVHDYAGFYVASVFDVVHDHGFRTGVWAGKSKFEMIDRNWDGRNGAPDMTGPDNGRDKIDFFVRADPVDAVEDFLDTLDHTEPLRYSFVHVRSADEFGHAHGWATSGYELGLAEADLVVGRVVDAVWSDPQRRASTAIIVTSDHGGPAGELLHSDATNPENYIVPMAVWAPFVVPGSDLYDLNPQRREPGRLQFANNADVQPIRGHEAANLALDLLGLPAVPGSVYNAAQDLRVN